MKRCFSLLVALGTMLACCVFASAEETACSPWAELYLSDAEQVYDIIPGELQGCDWQAPITRQEFCSLLYETLSYIRSLDARYHQRDEAELTGGSPFSDTQDTRIGALSAVGITMGMGDGEFLPEGLLTRQEAAAFLFRAAEYCGLQTFSCDLPFSDSADIAPWAAEAAGHICAMGVMNGMGNGAFAPGALYTREQAVATAIRLMESYPYLNNREDLGEGLSYRFNSMHHWVEDEAGNVILDLPAVWHTYGYRTDYGCEFLRFFQKDGRLLCAVKGFDHRGGTDLAGTRFLDVRTGETLLELPQEAGTVRSLSEDGLLLTQAVGYSSNTVDSAYTVWGVYDFSGNALLPPGATRAELEAAGYDFDI